MAIIGQLTVAPEELEAQAAQVNSATNDLEEAFSRFQDLINGTEHYWKGEASERHRSNFTKQKSQLEEIIARYREQVRDLQMMAGVYKEAETKAGNLADQLPASAL